MCTFKCLKAEPQLLRRPSPIDTPSSLLKQEVGNQLPLFVTRRPATANPGNG